jgi:hypothetical protein
MNQDLIKEYAKDFIAWGHGAWGDSLHFETKNGTRYKKSEYDLIYLEIISMLLEKVRDNQETKPENK